VIVFGPRVLYQSPLPRLMAMSLIKGDPELVARSRDGNQQALDETFAAGLRDSGARYVSIYKAMCPDSGCIIFDDAGMPVQFDYGHLTEAGSILIMSKVIVRSGDGADVAKFSLGD